MAQGNRSALNRVVIAVATFGGAAFFLGFGAWALADARSFYDQVATFPPYNPHFLHDAGAFQIGIGATLLLALFWRDALAVALGGAAIGSILHTIAHVYDRDLGGKDSDPVFLGILSLVLTVAALARRGRAT